MFAELLGGNHVGKRLSTGTAADFETANVGYHRQSGAEPHNRSLRRPNQHTLKIETEFLIKIAIFQARGILRLRIWGQMGGIPVAPHGM